MVIWMIWFWNEADVFALFSSALTGFEAVLNKPGADVTLNCQPDVAGDLSVTWMRQNTEVKNGTKYFLNPNSTALTVRAVGQYKK